MRHLFLPLILLFPITVLSANEDPLSTVELDSIMLEMNTYFDSIEGSMIYASGQIRLSNGVASLNIPSGMKFLNEEQSRHVIVDLWGNPSADDVLGMIIPDTSGVLSDGNFAFVIQYDEIGYVDDDDADDIDYDELMVNMKEEDVEENKWRVEAGYLPLWTVGWASPPFYDGERKVLHWAKELSTGEDELNTLNYNIRVLGRKGVLVLNAVSSMNELQMVKDNIPAMLQMVEFNDGYKYAQFDPDLDEVAAWTLGGLVAGKVLAKVGILALLLKNIKLVLIAIAAAAVGVWRFISGRKKDKEPEHPAQ